MPESISPETANRPARILIVDDNRDAADSLAILLRAGGNQTQVAYDAASALQMAEGCAPDVAIVDLVMPGTDGLALGAQLKAAHGVFLIAVTGMQDRHYRRRAFDAGFDKYLLKPVRFELLERILCRAAHWRPAPRTLTTSGSSRMVTASDHVALLRSPDEFEQLVCRSDLFDDGVTAVFGIANNCATLQGVSFNATRFSADHARDWMKDHGLKPMRLVVAATRTEPA